MPLCSQSMLLPLFKVQIPKLELYNHLSIYFWTSILKSPKRWRLLHLHLRPPTTLQPWPLDLLGPPLQLSCSAAALCFWHWFAVKSIQADCFWLFGQLVFELRFLHSFCLCASMLAQRLCPLCNASLHVLSFKVPAKCLAVPSLLQLPEDLQGCSLPSNFESKTRLTSSPNLQSKRSWDCYPTTI